MLSSNCTVVLLCVAISTKSITSKHLALGRCQDNVSTDSLLNWKDVCCTTKTHLFLYHRIRSASSVIQGFYVLIWLPALLSIIAVWLLIQRCTYWLIIWLDKVCRMLPWVKKSPRSINIWNTFTEVLPLCLIYQIHHMILIPLEFASFGFETVALFVLAIDD